MQYLIMIRSRIATNRMKIRLKSSIVWSKLTLRKAPLSKIYKTLSLAELKQAILWIALRETVSCLGDLDHHPSFTLT